MRSDAKACFISMRTNQATSYLVDIWYNNVIANSGAT